MSDSLPWLAIATDHPPPPTAPATTCRLGGTPVYPPLHNGAPPPRHPTCGVCGRPTALVAQVSPPPDGRLPVRIVYVFACNSAPCGRSSAAATAVVVTLPPAAVPSRGAPTVAERKAEQPVAATSSWDLDSDGSDEDIDGADLAALLAAASVGRASTAVAAGGARRGGPHRRGDAPHSNGSTSSDAGMGTFVTGVGGGVSEARAPPPSAPASYPVLTASALALVREPARPPPLPADEAAHVARLAAAYTAAATADGMPLSAGGERDDEPYEVGGYAVAAAAAATAGAVRGGGGAAPRAGEPGARKGGAAAAGVGGFGGEAGAAVDPGRAYARYRKRLEREPAQVARLAATGLEVLWPTGTPPTAPSAAVTAAAKTAGAGVPSGVTRPPTSGLPPCGTCGGVTTPLVQLLGTALWYLWVDEEVGARGSTAEAVVPPATDAAGRPVGGMDWEGLVAGVCGRCGGGEGVSAGVVALIPSDW